MASLLAASKRLPLGALGLSAALTLSSLIACSGDTIERGQIMLALQTDLALPKDVSRIRIQILRDGVVRFDTTYNVGDGPEDSKLPATLGIVGDNEGETVEVRIIGFKGKVARTLNKAVTTIPTARTALLRMPIQWLCDGEVTEIDSDTYESTCEPVDGVEHVCLAGRCVPVEVDSETLPAYTPGAVFGGGNGREGTGKCFPVEDCMQGDAGFDVTVNMTDCTVDIPADQDEPINVGLKTGKNGAGVCNDNDCYVPLDQDHLLGWAEVPTSSSGVRKVGLPPAVCARLKDGRATGLRASRSCDTKTPDIPTCGPWSSVSGGGDGGGGDGGDEGGEGGAPSNGGSAGGGGPGGLCEGFVPGQHVGALTGHAELDAFLQGVSDLWKATEQLKADAVAACLGIFERFEEERSVGNPPTLEEMLTLCTEARDKLGDAGGFTVALALTGGFCLPDDGQADCESACNCPESSLEERCEAIAGACEGDCFGRCYTNGPTPCNSFCDGYCYGTCDSGTCSNPDAPGGCGECSGQCVGDCEGTCSSSTCQGVCVGDASVCDDWADQTCTTALDPSVCEDQACSHLCAFRAEIGGACSRATVLVTDPGDASDQALTAIERSAGPLNDVALKAESLSLAAHFLATASQPIGLEASMSPELEACYSAGVAAFSDSLGTLGSTLAAAEYALGGGYSP